MRPRLACRSVSCDVWRVFDAQSPQYYVLCEQTRFDLTVSGPNLSAERLLAALNTLVQVGGDYLKPRYDNRLLIGEAEGDARQRAVTAPWRLKVTLTPHATDCRTLAREELLGPLGRLLAGRGLLLAAVAVKRAGEDVHRASLREALVEQLVDGIARGRVPNRAALELGLCEQRVDDFGRVTSWLSDPLSAGREAAIAGHGAAGHAQAAPGP